MTDYFSSANIMTTPAVSLPFTIKTISGGAGTGAGGNPGSYLLVPAGDYKNVMIYGTVGSDGKVSGDYKPVNGGLSYSSAPPSLSWPPEAGFTTAPTNPTVTIGLIPENYVFEAPSSDGTQMLSWTNSGGQLSPVNLSDGTQIARYLRAGVDSKFTPIRSDIKGFKTEIGSDLSDISTQTIGDMFTTGTASSVNYILFSKPTPYSGLVGSVSISFAAAGTGILFAASPQDDGTYQITYLDSKTVTSGTNTFDMDNRYFPPGTRFAYKRVTGGTPICLSGTNLVVPYVASSTPLALGGSIAKLQTMSVTLAAQFTLTTNPSALNIKVDEQVSLSKKTTSAIGSMLATLYSKTMTSGNGDASTSYASASFYWGTVPSQAGGSLLNVRLQTTVGGLGKLILAQLSGTTVTFLESWVVSTTGGGTTDTFDWRTLGIVNVPGQAVVFYAPITSGGLKYSSGGSGYKIAASTLTDDGNTAQVIVHNGATPSIELTMGYMKTSSIAYRSRDKSLRFEYQTFGGTTATDPWVINGWTWNNGLTPSAYGWTNQAIWNNPSTIANRTLRAKIRINSLSDKVGLIYNCTAISYGGVGVILNAVTNKMEIYYLDANNVATAAQSVDLPTDFVLVGGTYIIELVKNRLVMSAKITQSLTRRSVSWSRTYVQSSDIRDKIRYHGSPGFVCLSGNPLVLEMDYCANVSPQPYVLIIGDSISEGSAMGVATSNWQYSWTYLLDNARGRNDVVIAARGGDTTTGAVARMAADLSAWQPKYVLFAIGTNDSDQNTVRSNMTKMVAEALNIGATPVFGNYVPRTGIPNIQTRLTAQNADFVNRYYGPYDYIDFAAAVSVNNDRVTIDQSLYFDSQVHPNIPGAANMFAQLQVDAPYLLD